MVNYRLPFGVTQLSDAAQAPGLQSMPFEGFASDSQVPKAKPAGQRRYKSTGKKWNQSRHIKAQVKSSGEMR